MKEPSGYRAWVSALFESSDYSLERARAARPEMQRGLRSLTSYDDQELCELWIHLMEHCGEDLAPYTDDQVGDGLNDLFNGACSGLPHQVRDSSVIPFERKMDLIRSIEGLYRQCFAVRCPPTSLGPVQDQLAETCYMLWDVTPLSSWSGERAEEAHRTITELFVRVLEIPHAACVESILHAVGDDAYFQQEERAQRIAQALAKNDWWLAQRQAHRGLLPAT